MTGLGDFNSHVSALGSQLAAEPRLSADIQVDGLLGGVPQVDHIPHIQMIDILQCHMGASQLRHNLQIGFPENAQDLLGAALIRAVSGLVGCGNSGEDRREYGAGQAD